MNFAHDNVTSVTDLAASMGMDPSLVRDAMANIADGSVACLVVSGKQGSGKDTIAPLVLADLGYLEIDHHYYAIPLKREADAIIDELRREYGVDYYPVLTDHDRRDAFAHIAEKFAMPVEQATVLCGDLIDAARDDLTLHARVRTPLMRFVLQYLGTNIRRAQDENYWVKLALQPALAALAAGVSVFLTDGRFPNEITFAQQLGAIALRLDISEEVQRERLFARDGVYPDPESLLHLSETALDDFEHFDVRVRNEGTLAEVLAEISSAIPTPRARAIA